MEQHVICFCYNDAFSSCNLKYFYYVLFLVLLIDLKLCFENIVKFDILHFLSFKDKFCFEK